MNLVQALVPRMRDVLTRPAILGRSAGVTLVCLLVVLLVLLKVSPVYTQSNGDELTLVYDSVRMCQGQVIYRDFFNFPPPGVFALMSGWLTLTGTDHPITSVRYLNALWVLLGWLLCARALTRAGWTVSAALILSALYPLLFFIQWSIPSHHWLGVAVFFLAFEGARFWPGAPLGKWGWLWIGAATALGFWVLQTTGALMAVYWGIVYLRSRPKSLGDVACAATGFALAAGSGLLRLAFDGALGPFVKDVFLWTLSRYRIEGGVNAPGFLTDLPARFNVLLHNPGKPPLAWACYGSLGILSLSGVLLVACALLGGAGVVVVLAARRRRLPSAPASAAVALTFVAAALFMRGKTDWPHLCFPLALPWGVWMIAAGAEGFSRKALAAKLWPVLWTLLLAGFLFTAWPALFKFPALEEFTDADKPVRESYLNRFLRAQRWLRPDETIVDLPVGGRSYLYVRPAAVGFTRFHPLRDLYNSLEDHREAATQVEERKPACILIDLIEDPGLERAFLDPASPLAGVIKQDYKRMGIVEGTVLFLRHEPP